jgi:5-methylcytosine-specific restriction endonuclease McrA
VALDAKANARAKAYYEAHKHEKWFKDARRQHKENWRRRHGQRPRLVPLLSLSERRKLYYRRNRKRILRERREYYQNNKASCDARSLAYYHSHPQVREYRREWYGRSPRRLAIIARWKAVGCLCYICGFILKRREIEIDHVIPSARGGSNKIRNLMPTHSKCNRSKGDRLDYPIRRMDLVEVANGARYKI